MTKLVKQSYYDDCKWKKIPPEIVGAVVDEVRLIAKEELEKPLARLAILDVGSGRGEYAIELAKYAKKVVGVEPYNKIYIGAIENKRIYGSKAIFVNKPIETFRSRERFDLAISLTTVEHMPNAVRSYSQVINLLKPGGILYLTAPNKWWPHEHHYNLWFLSWLPLPLANLYVRLTGRGKSYEDSAYSRSYFGMKKLFNKFNCTYEFILPHDLNSLYIGCGNKSRIYNLIKNLGFSLIRKFPFLWIFSKGFIMKIRKSANPFKMNRLYHYFLAYNLLGKGGQFLDYGCGRGEFIGEIGKKYGNCYGWDVDKDKIEAARKKYKSVKFNLGRVGTETGYKSNFFDRVFLFHVLEHVDSEDRAIREVARVLKPNGILYLASPYKGTFSWADMANLRYKFPFIHKILGKIFYGEDKYNKLFAQNAKDNLLGDSSLNRKWHKHYKEKEINRLLNKFFTIEKFDKYSLFQPFLLDTVNIWSFLFKKESGFINWLVWLDNHLKVNEMSYNFLAVARKKENV